MHRPFPDGCAVSVDRHRAAVIAHRLVALLVLACSGLSAAAEDWVEAGRRVYQQGISTAGGPIRAVGAGGVVLSGAQAACISCHRRSGMGSREGSVAVPPVSGPILRAAAVSSMPSRPGRRAPPVKPLRQESRGAYEDSSLARAIRSGIDPDGRPIDPLMPRFALDQNDEQALLAYLNQLSAAPPPGLDGGVLHLATIVTPDAEAGRRRVVTETLSAWAHSGALGGMPIDLQLWALEGPPEGWARQLRDLNNRRPVYAVISGAGRSQWAPVRDFCEREAVPCLFPIVDLAPSDEGDYYAMYLSRGVPIEARLLARILREQSPRPGRIVQLVADEAGDAAATLLASELGEATTSIRPWQAESPAAAIEDLRPDDVLVAWLDPSRIDALARSSPSGLGVAQVYFSRRLAAPEKTDLPVAWRRQALWISALSDPRRVQGKGALGLAPWLSHLKVSLGDEALLSEVYAATYYFGDALARMRGSWNREFLLEKLETANYARPAGSAYFSLSLGPGQREAVKAGHLLRFDHNGTGPLVATGARVTP